MFYWCRTHNVRVPMAFLRGSSREERIIHANNKVLSNGTKQFISWLLSDFSALWANVNILN